MLESVFISSCMDGEIEMFLTYVPIVLHTLLALWQQESSLWFLCKGIQETPKKLPTILKSSNHHSRQPCGCGCSLIAYSAQSGIPTIPGIGASRSLKRHCASISYRMQFPVDLRTLLNIDFRILFYPTLVYATYDLKHDSNTTADEEAPNETEPLLGAQRS
jgi:hypothetical protein